MIKNLYLSIPSSTFSLSDKTNNKENFVSQTEFSIEKNPSEHSKNPSVEEIMTNKLSLRIYWNY